METSVNIAIGQCAWTGNGTRIMRHTMGQLSMADFTSVVLQCFFGFFNAVDPFDFIQLFSLFSVVYSRNLFPLLHPVEPPR